jgi:hypothetical protein
MTQPRSLSLQGKIAALLAAFSTLAMVNAPALAADIIIWREVPTRNAIEPAPPGPYVGVPAERSDLVLSLVPGAKPLGEDEVGAVFGSPAAGSLQPLNETAVPLMDGSRGEAVSNLPGLGMGSFSSLGGLGGQISGQVGNAVGHALQGLGAITPGAGGQ